MRFIIKKLGHRYAEGRAQYFNCGHAWYSASVVNIRNGGRGQSGFLDKPVFRPAAVVSKLFYSFDNIHFITAFENYFISLLRLKIELN